MDVVEDEAVVVDLAEVVEILVADEATKEEVVGMVAAVVAVVDTVEDLEVEEVSEVEEAVDEAVVPSALRFTLPIRR